MKSHLVVHVLPGPALGQLSAALLLQLLQHGADELLLMAVVV